MKREELKEFISNTDKKNITEKMLSIASYFSDLSYLLEELEHKQREDDHELDVLKSKIYRDLSVTYKNIKTMTPTAINHQINCKQDVIDKTKEINNNIKKINIAKIKIKTLIIFSENLTNVGHNFRSEMKTIKKGV